MRISEFVAKNNYMNTHQVTTKWLGKMSFESTNPGGLIKMDSDTEFGGNNDGLRPKSMMLASLAGCTGIDIASLVEKCVLKSILLRLMWKAI